MKHAAVSRYPHVAWCGTWTKVGRRHATIEISMRQTARSVICTGHTKADVRWRHHGREDRFRVDTGTVRFCPADDDEHTLIGSCEPGRHLFTLLIPRGRPAAARSPASPRPR